MTSWISAVRSGSAIRSAVRPVFTMISSAGAPPSIVGTSRWQMMPRSVPASASRTCFCWCGGKKSIHAVDGLGRIHRVQRRHDQVAGLRRLDRGADRLGVAHLTVEDHVGVLPERCSQRREEVVGVGPHLALVDRRDLVRVQDLDRVLDGHDVDGLRLVDVLDHGRERRGLARARRTGDEDQAAVLVGELPDRVRETHFGERRSAEAQTPEHDARRPALVEDVRAEPSDVLHRVGEVRLAVLLQRSRRAAGTMASAIAFVSANVRGARSRRAARPASGTSVASHLHVEVRALTLEQAGQPAVELFHDRFGHVVHQSSLSLPKSRAAAPARLLPIVRGTPRLQFLFPPEAIRGGRLRPGSVADQAPRATSRHTVVRSANGWNSVTASGGWSPPSMPSSSPRCRVQTSSRCSSARSRNGQSRSVISTALPPSAEPRIEPGASGLLEHREVQARRPAGSGLGGCPAHQVRAPVARHLRLLDRPLPGRRGRTASRPAGGSRGLRPRPARAPRTASGAGRPRALRISLVTSPASSRRRRCGRIVFGCRERRADISRHGHRPAREPHVPVQAIPGVVGQRLVDLEAAGPSRPLCSSLVVMTGFRTVTPVSNLGSATPATRKEAMPTEADRSARPSATSWTPRSASRSRTSAC